MAIGKPPSQEVLVCPALQLRRAFVFIAGISFVILILLADRLEFTPQSRPLAITATYHGHHPGDIPARSTQQLSVWHSQPGTNSTRRKVRPKLYPGIRTTSTAVSSSQPTKVPPSAAEGLERKGQTHPFGYILTLHYSGQQSAGIRAMISQQCWVGSFQLPMLLVEPYIKNSVVGAQPDIPSSALKFGDFFDTNLYSRASLAEGYGQLASWEEFLERASRKVILIATKFQTERSDDVKVLWERSGGSDECYHSWKTEFRNNTKIHRLESYGFCIVKVVSCSYRFVSGHIFTANEMEMVIFGGWNPQEVTLVFTLWRGPWHIPNPQLPNPKICQQSNIHSNLTDHLITSPQLTEVAQEYEKLFLQPRNLVAVMLRMEHAVDGMRTLMSHDDINVTLEYDHCLHDVLSTVDDLRTKHGPGAVFATSDVGNYGSNAWNLSLNSGILAKIGGKKHVIQAAKDTVCKLYNNRLTFNEWESTFTNVTNGVNERGYIAALQKTLASRADCLVLVGGGSFLELALREYLHNHPNKFTWCVEVLCAKTSSTYKFQHILQRNNRS